jgi:hypothetical protein
MAAGPSIDVSAWLEEQLAQASPDLLRDVARIPDRDHFAAYNGTAPIEVSSGHRKIYRLSRRGNRRLNHVIHMAAVTQSATATATAAPTTTASWPRARPPKKPSARSSAASATPSTPASRPTPAGSRRAHVKSPGEQRGNDSVASAAGSHPRAPALRLSRFRTRSHPATVYRSWHKKIQGPLRNAINPIDAKRHRYVRDPA